MNIIFSVLYAMLFCWQVGSSAAFVELDLDDTSDTPLLANTIEKLIKKLESNAPVKYDSTNLLPIKQTLSGINGLRDEVDGSPLDATKKKTLHDKLGAIQDRIITLIKKETDRIIALDAPAEVKQPALSGMHQAIERYITIVQSYVSIADKGSNTQKSAATILLNLQDDINDALEELQETVQAYQKLKSEVDDFSTNSLAGYQDILLHEQKIKKFNTNIAQCASLSKKDCTGLKDRVKELLAITRAYCNNYERYLKEIDAPVSILDKLKSIDEADALQKLTRKIADDALLSDTDKEELIKKISTKTGESIKVADAKVADSMRDLHKTVTVLAAVAGPR